jgi:hypothetical protein
MQSVLDTVLPYHVVLGEVYSSSDLENGQLLQTLEDGLSGQLKVRGTTA